MGILRQATSGMSDTHQLSISMWVNVPGSGLFSILEFGDYDLGSFQVTNDYTPDPEVAHYPGSFVMLNTSNGQLGFQFQGAINSLDSHDILSTSHPPIEGQSEDTDFYYKDMAGVGFSGGPDDIFALYTPQIYGTVSSAAIGPSRWMHIFLSIDTSPSTSGRAQAWVNTGLCSWYNPGGPYIDPNSLFTISDPFGVPGQAKYYAGSTNWTPSVQPQFGYGSFVAVHQQGNEETGLYYPETTGNLPGFPITVGGKEFSLPQKQLNASGVGGLNNLSSIKYSDVQIWLNQYIEFGSNISKFVTLSGIHGTPASTALAADTFGQQDVLFKGAKAEFPTNLGTGGGFTQVGTIIDTDTASF